MTTAFRCSAASLADAEPLAGTAPVDTRWLFVEDPGPWGRTAVQESRLPDAVRQRLSELDGVRVQLIRRPGGGLASGVQVFTATRTARGFDVRGLRLGAPGELLELDLAGLADGRGAGLPSYDDRLWLVCTNGRRDLCCAEQGRPVAAALAERWPGETWETTHLGGHRFAATLLALPVGAALGRLDAESAVTACAAIESGELPLGAMRGAAGVDPRVQVAELGLRSRLDLRAAGAVEVLAVDRELVTLGASGREHVVRVEERPGVPRRLSCADDAAKPSSTFVAIADSV